MHPHPHVAVTRHIAPSLEPLTLAEAKLYLRVEHTAEDSAIAQMITAAREVAEEILNTSFLTQRWKLTFAHELPAEFALPYGPVQSVISLTRVEENGAVTSLDVGVIEIAPNTSHAICSAPQSAKRFEIIYEAGLGSTTSSVPAALRQSMLQHVAYLYGFRSLEDSARIHDITRLYAPFREVRV